MTIPRLSLTVTAMAAALLASSLAPAAADDAAETPVAPADAQVTFLAGLPYREAALTAAATAISSPESARFREHLTVTQAAQRFGASDAAVTRVKEAAARLGLRAKIDPTRLLARISGPVSAWEKAMGTTIDYQPAEAGDPYDYFAFPVDPADPAPPIAGAPTLWEDYYLLQGNALMPAPTGLATAVTTMVTQYAEYVPAMDVPAPAGDALSTVLEGVLGTDAAQRLTASLDRLARGAGRTPGTAPTTRALYYPGSKLLDPPTNPAYAAMDNCINDPDAPLGTGIIGNPLSPENFVGQDQLFRAYGLTGLQRRSGADTRSRVTVISLGGGFSEDDLDLAARCSGFTAPDVRITLGTGMPAPAVNVNDETTLDVQTVSATLRRAAQIQLVQASGGMEFSAALADAYTRALTSQPKPHAITLSYGICEPLQAGRGMTGTVDGLFEFAAVVGTTIAVSSGDGGSSVCQEQFGEQLELVLALYAITLELQSSPDPGVSPEELAADLAQIEQVIATLQPGAAYAASTAAWPASSPFAMAVGGTQIVMNGDGSRAGEVVWNDTPYMGGVVGNLVGTGGPSSYYRAPWYQQPLTGGNTRIVPDIAAQAGPFPSLPIVMNGSIIINGGTSQASPMMAAAMALLSAHEREAGRPTVGFVNPWLYWVAQRHPATMYDVTAGDNQFAIPYSLTSTNIPACCQASPGYDAATGLGVPQFNVLIDHVQVR